MNLTRLALVAALTAAACSSDPQKMDPEQALSMHREFALRYYDDGDLDRAEQQVDKGLELAPKDDKLLLMKGWIRQRRGSTEDIFVAENVFRELVDDGDYRALLGLAEALERKGVLYWESAGAVESGERVTQAPDPIARAEELRVTAQVSWMDSVDYYERTLEVKPGEIQAINGLQRVHALVGDYDESLQWSRTLIDQTTAEIRFWRGQLERPDLTAQEEARLRELLTSSIRLQSGTHLHASTVLQKMKRPKEALAQLDEAIVLSPEEAELHSRRAQLLYRVGRPEEAVLSLKTFLRLSDRDFDDPDIVAALEMMTTWEREIELAVAP